VTIPHSQQPSPTSSDGPASAFEKAPHLNPLPSSPHPQVIKGVSSGLATVSDMLFPDDPTYSLNMNPTCRVPLKRAIDSGVVCYFVRALIECKPPAGPLEFLLSSYHSFSYDHHASRFCRALS
jgi:hypothetical protein